MVDPLIKFYSALYLVFTNLPQPYLAIVYLSFFLSCILFLLNIMRWL